MTEQKENGDKVGDYNSGRDFEQNSGYKEDSQYKSSYNGTVMGKEE